MLTQTTTRPRRVQLEQRIHLLASATAPPGNWCAQLQSVQRETARHAVAKRSAAKRSAAKRSAVTRSAVTRSAVTRAPATRATARDKKSIWLAMRAWPTDLALSQRHKCRRAPFMFVQDGLSPLVSGGVSRRNLRARGESPARCAVPGYVAGGTEKNGDLRRSSGLVQRERRHASELAWCDNRDSAQPQRAVLREVARGDGISESHRSAQKNFGVSVYAIDLARMCVCVVRGPSRIWFLVRKHFTQFNNSSL